MGCVSSKPVSASVAVADVYRPPPASIAVFDINTIEEPWLINAKAVDDINIDGDQEDTKNDDVKKPMARVHLPILDKLESYEQAPQLSWSEVSKALEDLKPSLDQQARAPASTKKKEAPASLQDAGPPPAELTGRRPVKENSFILRDRMEREGNKAAEQGKVRWRRPDPLEGYPERPPPGNPDGVVLYTTTLRGVRRTFEDCEWARRMVYPNAVDAGVEVDERDVSLHGEFLKEVRELAGSEEGGGVAVPRLFVMGRYVGGIEEMVEVNESGKMAQGKGHKRSEMGSSQVAVFEMDRAMGESPGGVGSVKAAISLYRQKFNGRNEDLPSKSGELQKAQLEMGRLKETKKSADRARARAELELVRAKGAAKELGLQIKKSNARALMARNLELPPPRDLELLRELSDMKRELCRLKLDVASALESKSRAERTIEASNSKAKSYMRSVEELGREIEEVNEEHVLVELARIEAERECKEIEAHREDEAARFSNEVEAAKVKIAGLQKEAAQAKGLETQLAITNADLSVLQGEMELVRAMERKSSLKTAQDELRAAKKELASINAESLQFMTSMDTIRKELVAVTREAEQLKRQEQRAESSIGQLNSRLLKAKARLEAAAAAEERSEAIVSNLSAALQQLQAEMEAVEEEEKAVREQTRRAKQQIESREKKMTGAEARLQDATLELQAAKASEAAALRQLREVAQRTVKDRSMAKSSTVTISRSEYEYLTKGAESAQMVADMKVAAAQAWIAALRAEEKQILMTTEMVEMEMKEHPKEEKDATDQNGLGDEEEAEALDLQLALATPRKPRPSAASARKAKARRSSVSSGIRHVNPRSPSFTIKRRTTMMPNLVRFLRKGSVGKQR